MLWHVGTNSTYILDETIMFFRKYFIHVCSERCAPILCTNYAFGHSSITCDTTLFANHCV